MDNIYVTTKTNNNMNEIELYNQYNELLEILIVDDFNNNQELEELIVDICTIDENEIDYYNVTSVN